jgi:hypothetical protein
MGELMDNPKKITAAIAAVTYYMRMEEEASAICFCSG